MGKEKKGKTVKPGKQRKRMLESALHARRKHVTAHASKELRKSIGKRSITLRKGDKVKVVRGKHKGKEAKVSTVNLKDMRVSLEGVTLKRVDGREKPVPFNASNLTVKEVDKSDEKRFKTR